MELMSESGRQLEPLEYHRRVVDYLKRLEPEVWAWASSQKSRSEHLEQVRAGLLRDTYRLEANAHLDVYAVLDAAMQRLGITAPVTLYQAGSSAMNAALVFVPEEVHIVLQGPLLERLSEGERLAMFGHELAHHVLWSVDDGDFLVADRILNDALGAQSASHSQRETFRRYALQTELFADRGGAIAAQALEPAISTLVKVHTGIVDPDPAAYLRQAAEIDAQESGVSSGTSHPETFVRARALQLWWQRDEKLDHWLEAKLIGPLTLARLDLPGQVTLQRLTRGFLTHFLSDATTRSELALNQVRALFPDWSEGEAAVPPSEFSGADDSLRDYLNALMLDVALVDPDTQDAALARAMVIAGELGSTEGLLINLKRDAKLGKREIDKLRKQASAVLAV